MLPVHLAHVRSLEVLPSECLRRARASGTAPPVHLTANVMMPCGPHSPLSALLHVTPMQGLTPYLLRSVPNAAIQFTTFEYLKKVFVSEYYKD